MNGAYILLIQIQPPFILVFVLEVLVDQSSNSLYKFVAIDSFETRYIVIAIDLYTHGTMAAPIGYHLGSQYRVSKLLSIETSQH